MVVGLDAEVDAAEVDAAEVDAAEVDAAEVDAAEVDAAQVDAAEVDVAETVPEAVAEIVALVVSGPAVRTVERSDMGEVETVEVWALSG
jgi:hypothetical protein